MNIFCFVIHFFNEKVHGAAAPGRAAERELAQSDNCYELCLRRCVKIFIFREYVFQIMNLHIFYFSTTPMIFECTLR